MAKGNKGEPPRARFVHRECGMSQEFEETEDGRLKCPACGWKSSQKLPRELQGFLRKERKP